MLELDYTNVLEQTIHTNGIPKVAFDKAAISSRHVVDAVGETKARDRFVITTDPVKGDLLAIAKQEKYPTFEIPPNIGGRFSVLTPVGTLPAALLGFNLEAMMEGARQGGIQARQGLF